MCMAECCSALRSALSYFYLPAYGILVHMAHYSVPDNTAKCRPSNSPMRLQHSESDAVYDTPERQRFLNRWPERVARPADAFIKSPPFHQPLGYEECDHGWWHDKGLIKGNASDNTRNSPNVTEPCVKVSPASINHWRMNGTVTREPCGARRVELRSATSFIELHQHVA